KGDAPVLSLMANELDYSMKNLAMPDGTKPYFLSYILTDEQSVSISTRLGALQNDNVAHTRNLDVEARVGEYKLDNTHQIRGERGGFDPGDLLAERAVSVGLSDDPDALRHALWLATDRTFKSAAKKFQRVKTNLKTMVEEEDKSDDFS